MDTEMTRREFVKTTAIGAAVAPMIAGTRVFGANDRIQVGIVGPGGRGGDLMNSLHRYGRKHNAELVAVCDIWNQRREGAAAALKERTGRTPKTFRTLAEICADRSIDALVIATPDFAHAPHCTQAVLAGKDVYVEKPLGCDFEQIKRCRDTVLQSDRIVQVGTQRRGSAKYYGCAQFVRDGGLGKVSYVEIAEPLFQPRWRIEGSETSLTEQDTDWKEFQNYTYEPERPFSARVYREFRLFWPFSTGCFCQWMSHQIDALHIVLEELPETVVASGGVYVWKDGRSNGDTVQALVTYPSGILVSYHMRMGNSQNEHGITLYGTCGTLDLNKAKAFPDGGKGEVRYVDTSTGVPKWEVDPTRLVAEGGVEIPALPEYPDVDIMDDWLSCIRTRSRPRAHIEAGFAHALATTMAGMSYREGRKVAYDARADRVSVW